jgi:hypothetical protein
MSIRNPQTVSAYVQMQLELLAAIENLQEFIETLPAPDDRGHIWQLHYGHIGDIQRIHGKVSEACELMDQWCEKMNGSAAN